MPRLYMIYAYTPIRPDRTLVRPIYMTEKRKGIFGWVLSNFLLLMTRLAYYALRDEDGQIYDNIQFNPQCLLAIDAPITHYINYVNRLEPSLWSTPDLRPESDPLDAPTLSTSLAL